MIYNTIICIGDSLTYGARDEWDRGYPAELAKLLHEKDPRQFWICINEGVSGERSGDMLKRLPNALNHTDGHLVILQTGTNDTRNFVPVEFYRDNIYQAIMMIKCSKSCLGNRKVILGSLISVEGPGLVCYSQRSEEYLKLYNGVLKGLSKSLKIPLVDLTSLKKCRIDGCHLDNTGYKEMARLFMETIITL